LVKLSGQAYKVAKERYFSPDEDSWGQLSERVGKAIAKAEKEENIEKYEKEFTEIIGNQLFIPAGRILRNAGFERGLLNCFSLGMDDNIESISKTIGDSMIVAKYGGGAGISFSSLRPKNSILRRHGGVSSGLVSFMKVFGCANGVIETGGERRAALLAMLDISHPDIEEFLTSKHNLNELNNFNISVAVNNKFLKAVKNRREWTLSFRGKEYKKIDAYGLWCKIINSAIKYAEPGILNVDYIREYNNSEYFSQFNSVNPCGEIPLERSASCCLGSLVLPNFATEKTVRWKELGKAIGLAIRFLDNVLTLNHYPLKEIEEVSQKSRRIGLGVTGLADMLLHFGLKYGSDESLAFIEKLFKFIRDTAYSTSIELAKEKGTFPAYSDKYLDNPFIKDLPVKIERNIEKFGIRNVAMLTCPPVGSTSLLTPYSSGIEPIFSKAYWRSDKINAKRAFFHPFLKKLGGELPDYFVDSHNLTMEEHLLVQATITQYIDNAVSKTINISKNASFDEISEKLLHYVPRLKGVTIYVDGSRGEQVLTPMTNEEIKKYLNDADEENLVSQCASGKCDL